jgi:hypothetical protein
MRSRRSEPVRGEGSKVKHCEHLGSGESDTETVTAALARQILSGARNGFDPDEAKSIFIPLTTATIPVSVESGPNADWSYRFLFDQPHVHDDGTVEYRVRCAVGSL